MHYSNLFDHVEICSKEKVLGGCESHIFVIGDKHAGRVVRVAEARSSRWGTRMILIGFQVILRIWRLCKSFCEAHGGPAPPPSWEITRQFWKLVIKYLDSRDFKVSQRLGLWFYLTISLLLFCSPRHINFKMQCAKISPNLTFLSLFYLHW